MVAPGNARGNIVERDKALKGRDIRKKCSSIWNKKEGPEYEIFYLQSGYGTFSVSHSLSDKVIEYIVNQEEKHHKRDFQCEFRIFLEHYHIEYDERYVWD